MTSRKRDRKKLEADQSSEQPSLLDRIRNMWEFANIAQYLFLFGKAARIDEDYSIEDLETECLQPGHSEKLSKVGLALLKIISSHRGLTPDTFDEHTRRQYLTRAPERNPFGDAEQPKKFVDLDVFTKIRILWQLSQWTMVNPEKIRERMPEQKDTDRADWRINPTGWDAEERIYYVLDDNRLYRQTEPPPPPPPPPKPKKNSKKAKAAARASKRQRLAGGDAKEAGNDSQIHAGQSQQQEVGVEADNGLGGCKWECIAITVQEYKDFLETIRRSDDANEKALYSFCMEEVLPVVEKAEGEVQRQRAQKEKELRNLERLATAKRSSRIAGKAEKQKEQAQIAEAERKRVTDLAAAKKEQERMAKMEKDRESRMMTREQRLREREARRILHEEELANLSEDNKKVGSGVGRMSERHLQAEIEKRKRAIEELTQEPDWIFDCSGCGVHGENLDDGSGIIACEKCNVWQHLRCLDISKELAEQKDFHFVCGLCKRREEDREKSARNPLKLDFRKLGSSASPPIDHGYKDVRSSAEKDGGMASLSRKRKASAGSDDDRWRSKKVKYGEEKQNDEVAPHRNGPSSALSWPDAGPSTQQDDVSSPVMPTAKRVVGLPGVITAPPPTGTFPQASQQQQSFDQVEGGHHGRDRNGSVQMLGGSWPQLSPEGAVVDWPNVAVGDDEMEGRVPVPSSPSKAQTMTARDFRIGGGRLTSLDLFTSTPTVNGSPDGVLIPPPRANLVGSPPSLSSPHSPSKHGSPSAAAAASITSPNSNTPFFIHDDNHPSTTTPSRGMDPAHLQTLPPSSTGKSPIKRSPPPTQPLLSMGTLSSSGGGGGRSIGYLLTGREIVNGEENRVSSGGSDGNGNGNVLASSSSFSSTIDPSSSSYSPSSIPRLPSLTIVPTLSPNPSSVNLTPPKKKLAPSLPSLALTLPPTSSPTPTTTIATATAKGNGNAK